MPKFTWAATWKAGSGAHLNTLLDTAHTGPALQCLFLPLHSTGKADSECNTRAQAFPTINRKVRSWIQKCSAINKHKVSTELKWFFFPFPFNWREREKKMLHVASFPWPTISSIKLQKQCFEMLEDADRKLKKRPYTKVKNVFLDGELWQGTVESWQREFVATENLMRFGCHVAVTGIHSTSKQTDSLVRVKEICKCL